MTTSRLAKPFIVAGLTGALAIAAPVTAFAAEPPRPLCLLRIRLRWLRRGYLDKSTTILTNLPFIMSRCLTCLRMG